MRIVGGALGGRRFGRAVAPETRPTSDRVREAVASALEARSALAGASVLDLYAGTGALAFEALSRGAARAVAIDRDARATRSLLADAAALGLMDRLAMHRVDLHAAPARVRAELEALAGAPFSLVFADPPYADVARAGVLLDALPGWGLLTAGAHLVLEHAARDAPPTFANLASLANYRYGDTGIQLLAEAHPA